MRADFDRQAERVYAFCPQQSMVATVKRVVISHLLRRWVYSCKVLSHLIGRAELHRPSALATVSYATA